MSRHVSADILARRKEGAVSTRKAARIDAHMSTCASCARTNSDLMNVSSLLAAVRLPAMPDSLAQRVQMAIADESAARAARSAALGAETRATSGTDTAVYSAADDAAAHDSEEGAALIPGRPDLPTRSKHRRATRRFRLPSLTSPLVVRGLAGAAAVAVVAGAGFLLANGQPHVQGSGHKTSSGAMPGAVHSMGTNAAASSLRSVSLKYQLQGKLVTTTALVSKANFERSSLARLARSDVGYTAGIMRTPSPTTSTVTGVKSAAQIDVTRLESCLSGVNAGRTVLVATIARYLGKRATIIVLRSLQSADILDIAIVGPACSASNPHLIFNTTIPAG